MSDKLKRVIVAVAGIAALAAGGAAIAGAAGGDDDDSGEHESDRDERATGPTADRAAKSALQAVGGGKVVEVERADDGESGYEVEIEKRDGSTVEVAVSDGFRVQSIAKDD